MHWESAPFGELKEYTYAVIFAIYKGKWLLCRHRERQTWEMPGGHIEKGESPEQAARRELYEESGALEFTLYPVADYRVREAGQIFLAHISKLGDLPESEMAETRLFETMPENLTYPEIIPRNFALVAKKRAELGI